MKSFIAVLIVLSPILAFAAGQGQGGGDDPGPGDPGPGPTTQAGTPEIPAGAAPIIVAGIMGAVLFVRSRRNKNRK